MSKLTIRIDGYGAVVIKRPRKLSRKKFDKAVTDAVVQTLQLTDPRTGEYFHPALGFRL